jgi:hypothetical protein
VNNSTSLSQVWADFVAWLDRLFGGHSPTGSAGAVLQNVPAASVLAPGSASANATLNPRAGWYHAGLGMGATATTYANVPLTDANGHTTLAGLSKLATTPGLSPGAAYALANNDVQGYILNADANNPADRAVFAQAFSSGASDAAVGNLFATRQLVGQDPSLIGGRTATYDPNTNSYSYVNNPAPTNMTTGYYAAPYATAQAAATGNPTYVQPGATNVAPSAPTTTLTPAKPTAAGQSLYYDPVTNSYKYA